MDSDTLAQQVAADLGNDILAAVKENGSGSSSGLSRSFGMSEAIQIGCFVSACAQLVVQIWQAKQDRALLLRALAEAAESDRELVSELDPERRLGLIARVLNKFVPDTVGSSPSIRVEKARTRQEWLTDWTGYGDKSRTMTQPVLVPFADMDSWIVYRDIHWTSPPPHESRLPRSVRVPAGFVSDLATIPSYFWWALPPTGRYGHAAILHDWLYWDQKCTRAVADRVFEVAMSELQVEATLRKTMWAAVRLGGADHWGAAAGERKRGASRILKRFPESPVTFAAWKTNPDVFA